MIFNSLPNSKEYTEVLNGYSSDSKNQDKPLEFYVPMIEKFLKDEIVAMKVCGCPKCNVRRNVYRMIQYIIADYRKLKGIGELENSGINKIPTGKPPRKQKECNCHCGTKKRYRNE